MRISRRGRRRLVLVAAIGGTLAVAAVSFKVLRGAQQRRLVAEARTDGLAAWRGGDLDTALEQLSFHVQHDKTDPEVILAFADARMRVPTDDRRHVREALGLYKHALTLLDGDPAAPDRDARRETALRRLVELYGRMGLRFEQIQASTRLLELVPDDTEALGARAVGRFGERAFDDALEDIRRLAALEPDRLAWRQLELEVRRRAGTAPADLRATVQAWGADWDDDGRYDALEATVLLLEGRRHDARAAAERAADRGASSLETLDVLVSTLDRIGLRDRAAEAIDDALRRFPSAPWVRQAHVHRLWQSGRLADARTALDAAEKDFDALDAPLLKLRALVQAASNDPAAATVTVAALRELARADADDGPALAAWTNAVDARVRLDERSWSEAMPAIEAALLLHPGDPVLHLTLGEVLAAAGETTQSVDAFRRAWELDPHWIAAGMTYGGALLQVGRAGDAFAVSRSVLDAAPPTALPPYLLHARALLGLLDGGAEGRIGGAIDDHAADVLDLLDRLAEQVPDEADLAALRVEIAAAAGREDRALATIESCLAREHPAPALLLAVAEASRRRGLDGERRLLDRAREEAGLTVPVAVALADLEAARGRPNDGLSLIDVSLAALDPSSESFRRGRRARLRYLLRIDHPAALDALEVFVDEHRHEVPAQMLALAAAKAWTRPALIERVVGHLREALGPQSPRVRLAEAQRLVRFRADDEASLAEAIMALSRVLERTPDSLTALTFMAEASLLGPRPSVRRAVEHLERAVAVAPGRLELYPPLVGLLQQEGDFESAGRYLERFGARARGQERLERTELQLLQRQGDFETALVRASRLFDGGAGTGDQLQLAAMHRRAGQLDEAEAIYARLRRERPDDPTVASRAADFYAATGRAERGLAVLEALTIAAPGEHDLLLGRFLHRHSDPVAAEARLRAAVEADPGRAAYRLALARLLLDLDRPADARAEALAGLRAAPDDVGLQGIVALADLARGTGDRAGAIAALREIGAGQEDLLALLRLMDRLDGLDDSTPPGEEMLAQGRALVQEHGTLYAAWSLAARLHARAGRMDEAIDFARTAVGRFPADGAPARLATELLLSAGRFDEALVEADAWHRRSLDDPLPAATTIARILLRRGRAADARAVLEPHATRLGAQRETNPDALETWLEVLLAAGDRGTVTALGRPLIEREADWRRRWLDIAGRLPDAAAATALELAEMRFFAGEDRLRLGAAWNRLAERTGSDRHFDRATATLQPALDVPALRLPTRLLLGTVAESRGDLETAEIHVRAALAIDPDHPVALNNLAWILVQSDRAGEAVPIAERAVAARPGTAPVLDTLARALQGAGRLDDAERVAQQALGLRPEDAGLRLTAASIALDRGDTATAGSHLAAARRALQAAPARDPRTERRLEDLTARMDPRRAAVE